MSTFSSLTDLKDKFQHLTQREQMLVLAVAAAALYFLFDALVFSPQKQREQALLESQKAAQAQVVMLSSEIAAVERTRVEDMDRQTREYRQLKAQVDLIDQMVTSVSVQSLPVKGLLASIMDERASARVEMVSVKTLPVKTVTGLVMNKTAPAGAPAAKSEPLYRQGVELELRGRYMDLMAYLQSLEEAYPNLFWSRAALTAGVYPQNTLRVSVFLLSTRPYL